MSDVGKTIERYFEAVGASTQAEFVDLFGEDVLFADPVGTPVLTGRDGVAKFHRGVERAWKRLHMRPQAIFARGDRAAAYWTAEGESTSGNEIDFEGINTFAVDEEGRIVHLEGFWDFEGVVGQM